MNVEAQELKFHATEQHGECSALLTMPEEAAALLVLGHGASSNMRHGTVKTISERCAAAGVASLRYNFPYSEHGRGRNSNAHCMETIRSIVRKAVEIADGLPIFAGGHSFSGRMTSMAASEEPLEGAAGLVFFAFPLHPSGKPSTERAEHLSDVTIPMLFLSGERDKLADESLLKTSVAQLGGRAVLHWLDTADHGFKTLKRRNTDEDVYDEMARVIRGWVKSAAERNES